MASSGEFNKGLLFLLLKQHLAQEGAGEQHTDVDELREALRDEASAESEGEADAAADGTDTQTKNSSRQ